MNDLLDHRATLEAYRSGTLPGLTIAETRELIESPSSLAFWRKRAGLTQAQLAEKVGIAQAYMSNLETGSRDGDVKLWMNIARVLGLPVDVIVDDN